jgi:ABC-type sugar transport system substrate-binding protein
MHLHLLAIAAACAAMPTAAFARTAPSAAPQSSPTSAASASPLPSPATSPSVTGSPAASSVDPAITARAKEWARRIAKDDLDRSQLDAQMNAALTDAVAKQVAAKIAPLGDPTSFTFVSKRTGDLGTLYVYRVTFKTATLDWLFALNPAGKINGMLFRPEAPAP